MSRLSFFLKKFLSWFVDGRTLLHMACTFGAMSCLRLLLSRNNVNEAAQDKENGWTALHRAVYHGKV